MIFPSKYNVTVYVQCSPVNLGATSFGCKINNLESPVQFQLWYNEKPNNNEIIEKEHQNLREKCMRHDIYSGKEDFLQSF